MLVVVEAQLILKISVTLYLNQQMIASVIDHQMQLVCGNLIVLMLQQLKGPVKDKSNGLESSRDFRDRNGLGSSDGSAVLRYE